MQSASSQKVLISKYRQTRLPQIAMLGAAIIVAGTLTVTVSARWWSSPPATPNISNQSVAQSSKRPELTLLPVQLRFNGFYPNEITQAPGEYELLLINASGEPDLTIQLQRENGEKLHRFGPKRGKNQRKSVHLTPGVYIVSVVENPAWTCRITISNE